MRYGEAKRGGDDVIASTTTFFSDVALARSHEKTPNKVDKLQPGKPTGVTVQPYNTGADARRTLEISWTANPNGNKAITQHEVEWSADGTKDWKDLRTVVGQVTSTLFTSLSPGTTRYIRVRSTDSDGDGPWSDVVSGTTNAVSRPSAPSSLTATVDSPSRITVSWTPGDDGGSPITKYRVRVFLGEDFSTETFVDLEPTVRSYTVSGLLASTKYTISVQPINRIGSDGSFKFVQPTTAAATKPGPPASLTATVTGPSTIEISWTAPSETGGSPITKYRVRVFLGEDFSTETFVDLEPTVRSYTVSGLLASTKYTISVQPINRIGSDGSFKFVQPTTAAIKAPAAPTGLTATADGATKIKLTWTAPDDNGGAAITGYRIESRLPSESVFRTLINNTGNTKTDFTHAGLSPSTQRFYRVRAINSRGSGGASSSATAITTAGAPPGLPTGFTATASGRTTINLSWAAPTNTGGLPITGYELQYSQNKTPRQWIQLGGGNIIRTSYAHRRRGRSASTTDHYRLRVSNNRGSSAWTSSVNATTDPAVVPGPPRGI